MKKLITSILLLVLLLNTCSAFALDLDLSKYSDEELKEVFELLNEEMLNRKMVKSAKIPVGRYTIGIDIPVGKYVIEMADKSKHSGPIIKIYEDESLSKLSFSEFLDNTDDTMIIELKKGNVLQTDETIILSTFVGIAFE